jgi:hypothetical protein
MTEHLLSLTEHERDILTASELTNRQLGERFKCSMATIKRAKERILAGEADVSLFRRPLPTQPKKRKLRNSDPASKNELCEAPLGCNPIRACKEHLEDLGRVYSRVGVRRSDQSAAN